MMSPFVGTDLAYRLGDNAYQVAGVDWIPAVRKVRVLRHRLESVKLGMDLHVMDGVVVCCFGCLTMTWNDVPWKFRKR